MFLNPRRARARVSRLAAVGRSQGRRMLAASGRARRIWAWALMISQVHLSPGLRIADSRDSSAEDLLEQAEYVFQLETAQERLL